MKNPPPESDPPPPPKFIDVDKIRENIEELEFWDQCVLKQLQGNLVVGFEKCLQIAITANTFVIHRREFIKKQNDNNTTTNP